MSEVGTYPQTLDLRGWVPIPDTDTKWQPPHVRSASGQYISYWNAFLFVVMYVVTVRCILHIMHKEYFS